MKRSKMSIRNRRHCPCLSNKLPTLWQNTYKYKQRINLLSYQIIYLH